MALLSLAACRGDSDTDASRPARRPEKRAPAHDKDDGDDVRCTRDRDRVCVGDDVVACDGGELGRRVRTCKDGCKDGRCVASCASAGSELIYVVDLNADLLAFDPRKLPNDPFRRIGSLKGCDANTEHGASPFSMSVDRQGMAWVLFGDGAMYKVSITDARCQRAMFLPSPGGSPQFGMGYATDEPGGATEKLYIAGNDDRHMLSAVDTDAKTPQARDVGRIPVPAGETQNPELTGTGDARLYGFFPTENEPSFVQEIDRRSGRALGPKWKLGDRPLGRVTAYAFAHWGGKFYIFVTLGDGSDRSTVHVLDRTTGKHGVLLESVPYKISGAGVSTCAPEKDQ
ncbi:MAG: hypothetical protein KIT31_31680 [Deltaproteobacteria bacterium]|nr:hypothetical protein [Deltaproteobacteria bacterium]